MAERVTGIVLAGGLSARMGRDKASLEIEGVSLLQRTAERLASVVDSVLIVARSDQQVPVLDLPVPHRVVSDRYPDTGPLGGIATGMHASDARVFAVTACDMPLLDPGVIRQLLGALDAADAAVPVGPDGREEPLCAVYRRECLPAIERCLSAGSYRVTSFYSERRVVRVRIDDALTFSNVNTPDDLERIGELLRREGSHAADDPGV